jgi:hypothetical protein
VVAVSQPSATAAQPSDPVEDRATVRALRLTAEWVLAAHAEANSLRRSCVCSWPRLRRRRWPSPASAPVTAAQVLIS